MDIALKIAIVDDDATSRLTAAAALDDPGYTWTEYASGESLLLAVEDNLPDLILMDIEMPGMSGIEACRAVRAAGHDNVQVIFVSAHNDLETRLTAYDAGGNDFIVKPYELDELARKAAVARQSLASRRELGAQAHYAQKTAFTAMSSMAEMGDVLAFMRSSFACGTTEALAGKLFDSLRQFGLDGLAGFGPADERQYFSSRGECTPLECGILDHAKTLERIFQFRDRLAINYPWVTLIVHPLPLDDSDRVGRLRDHLAVLAEGADARLHAMDASRRQQMQASGIGEAIIELTEALNNIDREQAAHRVLAAEIDEAFLEDLVAAFVHLGLTEDQERTLADLAQRTHQQLTDLSDANSDIGDRLRGVAQKLNKLVKN